MIFVSAIFSIRHEKAGEHGGSTFRYGRVARVFSKGGIHAKRANDKPMSALAHIRRYLLHVKLAEEEWSNNNNFHVVEKKAFLRIWRESISTRAKIISKDTHTTHS